jgi:hypothetical protein
MYRVKVKQITSGTELSGKTILSDGSGGFVYNYPQIQKGITFPATPVNGDLFYYLIDNTLYGYDSSRTKWLSVNTTTLLLGRATIGQNTSGYFGVADAVHSSTTGIIMPKNGTIISASVDNVNNMGAARNIEIRVNDSATVKLTITIPSGNKSVNITNGNVDFNAGDYINTIAISNSTAPALNNASLLIKVAWRN